MRKFVLLFISLLTAMLPGCLRPSAEPSPVPDAVRTQQTELLPPPLQSMYNAPAGPPWSPGPLRIAAETPAVKPPAADAAPPAEPAPAPIPAPPPEAKKPAPAKPKKAKPPVSTAASQAGSRKLTIAELTKKYPNLFMLRAPAGEPKAALTFDDGPDDKYTPQVLNVLKKYNVKATFFLVGSKAEQHPDLVRRMVREGHIVGNHSYSHALFPKLSDEKFESQIRKTDAVLKKLTGYSPRFLRPPYGEISESQLLWTAAEHMLVINWNVDSQDWRQLSAEQVLRNVMKDARPGSIILQHSGGGDGQDLSGSVEALPSIIERLRAKGLKLVTLPDLMNEKKHK